MPLLRLAAPVSAALILFCISPGIRAAAQATGSSTEGGASEAEQPSAGQAHTVRLTDYLPLFLSSDGSWQRALLEEAIATLAVDKSIDRTRLDVTGSPGARYDNFRFGSGAETQNLGTLFASRAALMLQDDHGGTWRLEGELQQLSQPALSSGGNQASAAISYAVPLLKNALGRLYALETRYLELDRAARTAEWEALLRERCAVGVDVYLGTWLAQEQWVVWRELLELKQKTFARTKRDYARRMVPKLDYLAAQSDWLEAQQRDEGMRAARDRAMVSFRGYWKRAPSTIHLESPREILDSLGLPQTSNAVAEQVSTHARLRATQLSADAFGARAEHTDRSHEGEISLVPQAGVHHFSRMFQPPGENAALTDFSATLSVVAEIPVIDPARQYEVAAFNHRRAQENLRANDLTRALTERALRALEAIEALDSQLALNAQQQEVLSQQLQEAGDRFGSGRLEFQDYLQHWEQYENARFERARLVFARAAAQADLIRTTSMELPACRHTPESSQ